MMSKRKLTVRLSDKERLIVQYITERLEAVSQNAAGKPVYARNLDQVMRDLFGVKKFTKTLDRARMNEALMINLMKRLNPEVLWRLCRSKEYYRVLCSLVAMDATIVHNGKKYNKLMGLEPMERPTNKIRKLTKEIKKSKKTYKACIKSLADILGIEKDNTKEGSIRGALEDWLDQREAEDDIFFDTDLSSLNYDTLSDMDEYVESRMRGKKGTRKRRSDNVQYGALDLGIEHRYYDDDDDDDDPLAPDDEDDEEDMMDQLADRVIEKMGFMQGSNGGNGVASESQMQMLAQVITSSINNGFKRLADAMTVDEDYEDEDDGYEIPQPSRKPTLHEMMDQAEEEQQNATRRPEPDMSTADDTVV